MSAVMFTAAKRVGRRTRGSRKPVTAVARKASATVP